MEATVNQTDVHVDGERYLAFDNVNHATAFAAGFNAGVFARQLPYAYQQQILRDIRSQITQLENLNIPAPWHTGFVEAITL